MKKMLRKIFFYFQISLIYWMIRMCMHMYNIIYIYIYIYVCVYICVCIYIYIYIYNIEREKEFLYVPIWIHQKDSARMNIRMKRRDPVITEKVAALFIYFFHPSACVLLVSILFFSVFLFFLHFPSFTLIFFFLPIFGEILIDLLLPVFGKKKTKTREMSSYLSVCLSICFCHTECWNSKGGRYWLFKVDLKWEWSVGRQACYEWQ